MNKKAGFTLIEIMLVMVLLSISAVAVIINLPDSKQDITKQQAERFYYRLQLLNEYAILNGRDLGIRVEENKASYSYLQLEEAGWQVLENKTYAQTVMPDGISLSLKIGSDAWTNNESLFKQQSLFEEMFSEEEEKQKIASPQLFVLSSGEVTPFQLLISANEDRDNGWLVDVKESGLIALVHTSELESEIDIQ
ncbi:type II secretion system minor pseudopilin GspH [Vibrio sp. TH_r3]|uniref:type II secretion system minor pseudopilin GspH n=1 Tax=Vibrio sp. TH_r3 TaxID=3082084 RepID=UPI002954AD39|nr:type II secretion system minor pseudopilin GspH [Vibrio sp. TH_r3]MDV7104150.1 type II secretion system minor pseudopilin GspH [Vibrio sp. TH_r3]